MPNDTVLDIICVLTWLCASLRTSPSEEPSVSHTFLHKDTLRRHLKFHVSLAELKANFSYSGTCWQQLIRRTVIAEGFPTPARNGEKGIELPLEVMMTISGIFTMAVVDGKYYLTGKSTALVPTQTFGDESIQWHFIRYRHKRIVPAELPRTSVLSVSEFGEEILTPDMLFPLLSRKRHFLGWCQRSQITLGTRNGTYTTQFTNVPEPSKDVQVQNLGANVGTPGMGIFTAVLTASFSISSTRIEQDQMGSLHYESILRSARHLPYILFDIDTKRAWLVPAICVILHLIHLQTRKEPNAVRPPYAQPHWNSGEAAFRVLIEHRRDNLGFEESEYSYTLEHRVREIWLGLISCPKKPAMKRPLLRDILYAYEMMDIVTIRRDIRLKKIELSDTGGWVDLTRAVQLVLVCRGLGEAVSSLPNNSSTCWSTVPTNSDLLCATVECLRALSDDIGGAPYNLTHGREWHCSGLLFEECVGADASLCNRLQQVVRSEKARLPPQPFPPSGAVIFGKYLQNGTPHLTRLSSTDEGSSGAHEATTLAERPTLHIHTGQQWHDSISRSSSPRKSNRGPSSQNSSIYSLGVNPPLVYQGLMNKSNRTNIALPHNFNALR